MKTAGNALEPMGLNTESRFNPAGVDGNCEMNFEISRYAEVAEGFYYPEKIISFTDVNDPLDGIPHRVTDTMRLVEDLIMNKRSTIFKMNWYLFPHRNKD